MNFIKKFLLELGLFILIGGMIFAVWVFVKSLGWNVSAVWLVLTFLLFTHVQNIADKMVGE